VIACVGLSVTSSADYRDTFLLEKAKGGVSRRTVLKAKIIIFEMRCTSTLYI
jgi:hypothetical protein